MVIQLLDRIEVLLIKLFLVLAACLVICQYFILHPRWSEMLGLINRLEGIIYSYGGLQ